MPAADHLRQSSIETTTAAKAFGIALVVANHAQVAPHLAGGLNILLVVSGMAMATSAFQGTTTETLRSLARFAGRLFVPAVLISCATQALTGRYRLAELLMVSNWVDYHRVALFPIWYVQAVVQISVFLIVVFFVFQLIPRMRAHPRSVSVGLFAVSSAAALISYLLWDTEALQDKLPHLMLWQLVFGWVVWGMHADGAPTPAARALTTALLLAVSAVLFLGAPAYMGESRFFWMNSVCVLLVWKERIVLPSLVCRLVNLVAQSSLWIFFGHYYFFSLTRKIGGALGSSLVHDNRGIQWAVGVVAPVVAWVLVTAGRRAFRVFRRQRRGRTA